MANQLKMAAADTILTLYGLGWSQRRIAGELGIDRETVARYISSIRRFVQRLDQSQPIPFRRMEVPPGAEGQVDFGTGAPIGQRRRPHAFRVVLSFSRKGYSEVVYHQTTEDFLRCLENAFWHFGGVPQICSDECFEGPYVLDSAGRESAPARLGEPDCGHPHPRYDASASPGVVYGTGEGCSAAAACGSIPEL